MGLNLFSADSYTTLSSKGKRSSMQKIATTTTTTKRENDEWSLIHNQNNSDMHV